MSDFNTSKVDGNTVGSAEWNQLSDVDNLTTTSGQTPSTTDLFQLSIASARYSSGGQFFTDSGTANTYVLSSVSPFKSPVDATNTYFNGMTIRFRAGNANSGASTININGAGLKNLKKEDGSTDLTAGNILATKDSRFRYNGTSFVLIQDSILATTTTQGASYLNNPITIANNIGTPNTKIDFLAGVMTFDDGSGQINTSAMTGDLANAFGTSDGMLDTGTKANTSDYSLFAIYNPTTGVIKPLASLSRTVPTMPSGFTKKDYRGKILTDASGNIIAFLQYKDRFEIVGTYPFKQFPANTTTFTDISFGTNYAKEVRQNINVRIKATETITTSWLYIRDKFSSDSKIISTGEENTSAVNIYSYLLIDIVSNSAGIWQYKTATTNSYVVATNDGFYLTGWIDYNLKI
jgi:hypothetical protein